MTTEPTDAELKAMWQLHAADIGGIFCYARAVLAKWGQPALAAQQAGATGKCMGPRCMASSANGYAHSRECIDEAAETQGWTPTANDYAKCGFHTPGRAAPQPVAREPLSHAQAKALVLKYGNDTLNLVFQVELAHGIKGGQHGAESST